MDEDFRYGGRPALWFLTAQKRETNHPPHIDQRLEIIGREIGGMVTLSRCNCRSYGRECF